MSGDGSMTDRDVCQNYLDSQAAFFASLQKQIDTVRTTCDQQLNILREGFESKFAALEGKVTGLQSDVAALQNELARQEPVDQHITATQAKLTTEVDKLKDASKKQKSSIEKLTTQNETLITAFNSLEARVSQHQPAVDFMDRMQALAGSRDHYTADGMQRNSFSRDRENEPGNGVFRTFLSAMGSSDCVTAPEHQRSATFGRSGFVSDKMLSSGPVEQGMAEPHRSELVDGEEDSAHQDHDSLYSLTSDIRKRSSAQRELESDHDDSESDVPARPKPSKRGQNHAKPPAKKKKHSTTTPPTFLQELQREARKGSPTTAEPQNDEEGDTIEVAAKRPRASTLALEEGRPQNALRLSASPSDVDSPLQDSGVLLQDFQPRREKAVRPTHASAEPPAPTVTGPLAAPTQDDTNITALNTNLTPPGTQPTPPTAPQAPASSAPPTLPTTNGSVRRSGRPPKPLRMSDVVHHKDLKLKDYGK